MPGDSLSDVVIVDVTNIGIQGPPGPVGPIGPAGPSGTTGLTPIIATGGTAPISLQDHFGYIITVRDFGATGNGTADDTAAIQAAITGVGAGLLFWPEGTYKISGTLTMPTGQRWQGASMGATVLQWAGGNNTDIVNTVPNPYVDKGGIEGMTIHAGTATGMTLLHLQNTHQSIYRNLYLEANSGAGNICLHLDAGVSITSNCCHNAFYHIIGRNCAKGVVFTGVLSPNSVATDNGFFFLDMSSAFGITGFIGIEFQRCCDSNQFYYTRITLAGPSGTCVLCNSLDPTGAPTVYNEVFHGLMLDNIGSVPNATGIQLNSSQGIFATGVFISPAPYTGNVVGLNADITQARSFYISTTNANLPGGNVSSQIYQHAFGDHSEPQLIVPGFTRTRGQLGSAPIGFANRLFATPIFVPSFYTAKTLAVAITVANATSAWNVRMGIYADNGFGKPGALVAATDGGNLAIAQGAVSGETLTLPTPVLLWRGLYWLAVVVDVVGASVLCSGPSGPSDAGTSSVNFPVALAGLGNGAYAAFTFGALPTTFPAATLSPGLDTPVVILGL